MSMDMGWADIRKRTMKYREVTLYIPTTRYTNEEYLEVLQDVKEKVLTPYKREARIPVIGVDVNRAMGVLQMDDGQKKYALKHIAIGPCGIGR